MAYQIAFDLEDNATQEFLQKVVSELPVSSTFAGTHEKTDGEAMETDDQEYVIMFSLL
jgi:hypothetical protein